jgi:membrane-associated phospholipid phosphatase
MSPIAQSFTQAWRQHRSLLLVGAAYSVFSVIYALWAGTPVLELKEVLGSMGMSFVTCYAFMGGAYGVCLLKKLFGEWRAKRWRGSLRAGLAHVHRVAGDYVETPAFAKAAAGVIALLPINFSIAYKSLIPFVNNYHWDPLFARWDKLLFFGRYPQQVVVPLVDALQGVKYMNLCYNAWFLFFLTALGYALFLDGNDRRRLTFLWGFVLIWIVGGSFLATVFSSVGPVFYHQFYPALPDIYKGILGDTGSSRFILDKLVEWTRNGTHIDANGISAMPSMHLSVAMTVVLYYSRFNRYAFWLALFFFASVFTSVVYTGLHYAVDGYAGILVAFACWRAADFLAARDAGEAKHGR